ncbi:MAG: type II toxin-antitoxin system VapC family toxin [Novosphingobium sp.]
MIIVDTSVWVDLLRGIDSPLDEILGTGEESLHPFVYGELLLNGLPKRGSFAERLEGLKPAPVATQPDVAAFIIWAKLAGTGVGYVDTHLLVAARLCGGSIMTKDTNLAAQAERLGVAYAP